MDNISTQMRKGFLEYIILGIISRGDVYGAELLKILKSGDLIVVEGTIYPLLSRLKRDGLINSYWLESKTGHPRKYFNLTENGKEAFIIMEKNWLDIKNSIQKILNK